MLLSEQPGVKPHVLFFLNTGPSSIMVTSTLARDVTAGKGWTAPEFFLNSTAFGNPFVEPGPPPLRLSDGNIVREALQMRI